ncbi:MAG: type I restriction endonuclease subunit R [Cytophagales bacterium CG12_big_fil_rev_8_21_14_0_65_40_12]|nr:MAG: type I restriction endonuclease subunit R [Cytophagales bacterium CG12_big_fil_rev_8_21_14_0_65_40_12]PIW03124.1 MAG: type I restriction endonuclease subunit R [Cytophagales bacterium CG17_big_fil_post_rev_8_21_14_2_50_40_13]
MSSYNEWSDSQSPAITLLKKLGWQYLSPEQALEHRGGLLSNVLLEGILHESLERINRFEYKGQHYPFSQSNIQSAINQLKNIPDEGLVRTNEQVYDLLTLGRSFTENIQADQKAFTLRYIDWNNLESNVFHVTEEFEVEGIRSKKRPDIVLFVNGIPFTVIENKRRDKNLSLDEAISQTIRNQKKKEGIPRLFHYAQMLMAVQPNEVKYATVGTSMQFWANWREDNQTETERLLKSKAHNTQPENRLTTEQDRVLVSLCKPERLMEFTYKFVVFDQPEKKIARYQQFFAVEKALKQIKQTDKNGVRKGGVIWHTQGSGKSLTMVMLSKAIALDPEIPNARVVVVTDRVSLDKQIYKTFFNCGKNVKKAKSGNDLIELLKDKGNENITAILDKFRMATKRKDFKDDSKNLFVLVDESHRSQYGSSHMHMKRILPNACFIGFTGTPLLKPEKSTARKFGGFIHEYTIDQAVKDKAVLPLLYEGRAPKISVNKTQIDKGFERLTAPLSEEAAKDLKKKHARISKIYESEQVIEEVAYDISVHYTKNWKGTGFKAQLAVPKIDTAIRYQKYFESQSDPALKINSRVVFTPPDSRSDYDGVWKESSNEAKQYWEAIVNKYGNQEFYENKVVEEFKDKGDEVELLIVVSKLLTGFDAPRNTVFYLAKPLMEHNLLQAIARVNRLCEGKDFGYIIDYVGVLGKLDEALTAYSAFEGYEEDDLKSVVTNILEEVRKVPLRLDGIWDLFKGVNRQDKEAMERHLQGKNLRDVYHERVLAYFKALQLALASEEFYKEFSEAQIKEFMQALKFFREQRKSVQYRYAEIVSYHEYEPRVRKLLDTYVGADEVQSITGEVNIFDENMVREALEQYGKTPASKADMIANQMKKVITENMEKDEAYYKKFSEMIDETIRLFNEGRLEEKDYLDRILKTREQMQHGEQEGVPSSLASQPKARAFFGALREVLKNHHSSLTDEILQLWAETGIVIETTVSKLTIRDWKKNIDVGKQIENAIEDYLISHRNHLGVDMTFDEIDQIIERCLKVAKNNY